MNGVYWKKVCHVDDIPPYSGVATLINGQQVAIFRTQSRCEVYAISNYDPFSDAYVLSRGLVGDKDGILKVASPMYKHNFDLLTGRCLDDDNVKLPTWCTRIVDGIVQVEIR
jgi:nitrite reductase (NADH) small subunit